MGGQLATGSSIYMASAGVPAADSAGLSSIKSFSQLLTSIAAMPLAGGTFTGNVLFSADNTYTIGAAGATRPSAVHVGTGGITTGGNISFTSAGATISNTTGELTISPGNGFVDIYKYNAAVASRFWNTAGTHYIECKHQSNHGVLRTTAGNLNMIPAGGAVAITGAMTLTTTLTMGSYTVATLPSASSNSYATANVSDSSVSASGNYGATVAGGGSNKVKVFSDGTNWVIA